MKSNTMKLPRKEAQYFLDFPKKLKIEYFPKYGRI